MAAVVFVGSHRHERSAGDDVERIGGGAACRVDRPACGDRLLAADGVLDLAERGRGRRHVDHDRRLGPKPGMPTAIGLVPSRRSAPHSGATMLVVFVIEKPIRSRLSACST